MSASIVCKTSPKEMEDILIESEDGKTMEGVLRPVLERCRTNSVLLSRLKINIGPEVSNDGLDISATEVAIL